MERFGATGFCHAGAQSCWLIAQSNPTAELIGHEQQVIVAATKLTFVGCA
jgi:hypothetical protein